MRTEHVTSHLGGQLTSPDMGRPSPLGPQTTAESDDRRESFTRESFSGGQVVKIPPANVGDIIRCQFDPWPRKPLEEGMATHSNTLAWRIPWTEEPGGLQSTGSQRVRQD